MHLSMLSPSGGTPVICGTFDFLEEFLVKSPLWGPKICSNQIKYPPPSNAWFLDEKRVDIINNPNKVRCSINLYGNEQWEVVFLCKYKNNCLPLLKTAVFQGFSRATPMTRYFIWPVHRYGHEMMCLGPIPACKKANVATLGPRFLVKFLRVGVAIEVKCPKYAQGPPHWT